MNIDRRVVEMQFDNKQFERGVKDTVGSLKDLKKGLDLSGSVKNLADLQAKGDKFSLANIAEGVQSLADRFSTLGIIGMSVLHNLTTKALELATNITKALTVQPMKDGFAEYELSMNSVRTIMNGTGESLETVNKYLDELNRYADRTIYSFSDMTTSIGKFTNAGVGLPIAVEAIKGVANATADAGQGAQQASMAMYNFSQAISSGTLKLQDWKSIELANIATKSFKEELIKTGLEMGTLAEKGGKVVTMTEDAKGKVANAEVTWQKFRDTLKENWITSDVLLATLGRYSDTTTEIGKRASEAATKVTTFTQLLYTAKESLGSGWKATWDIVFGDFNEATELWTGANNIFSGMVAASEEARNSLLKGGLSTGWKQLMDQGISDTEGFKETVIATYEELSGVSFAEVYGDEAIENATKFRETLFDGWANSELLSVSIAKTADSVRGLSKEELAASGYTEEQAQAMFDLDEKVKNGTISMDEYAKKLVSMSGRENIIVGLSAAFTVLGTILKPIGETFREVFPAMTGKRLYDLTAKFKDFFQSIKIEEKTLNNLRDTFKGLFSVLNIVKTIMGSVLSVFGQVLGAVLPAGGGILEFTAGIGRMLTRLDESIQKTGIIKASFEALGNGLALVASGIAKAIRWIGESLAKLTGNVDFNWFAMFAKVATWIGEAFRKIGEAIRNAFGGAEFNGFLSLINGGILAAILLGIRKFMNKLTEIVGSGGGILGPIKDLLDGVKGSLEAWQQSLKANTLLKIAGAIALLTSALFILSTIDPVKMATALGAITVLFTELFGSMAIFSKIMAGDGFRSMAKITTAMIGLSVAILILSFAMKNLASLDWNGIAKGLTAIGVLMLELALVSIILDKSSAKMIKGGAGLILFATGLVILAQAVKTMGSMQWDEIGRGLTVLTAVLTELVIISIILEKTGAKMAKGGMSLILLSTGLVIMAQAIKSFGSMQWDEIGRGLTVLTAVLVELVVVAIVLEKTGAKLAKGAFSLILFSTGLVILAQAMKVMGGMSWEEIGRGLTVLAGSLVLIVAAMKLLPKNMIGASASLILVSTALVILSKALGNMGGMSWEEIAKGLVMLAGSLVIIVAAMKLMTGALPGAAALLVISAALLILTPVLLTLGSMSWESIAKGLVMLAGVFAIFGIAALLLTPVIPMMFALAGAIALLGIGILAAGAGLLAFGLGLTALAAALAASGGAIYSFVESMISLIPMILTKLGEGLVALAEVIGNSGAALTKAFTTILLAMIESITAVAPKAVEAIFVLLDAILASLVTYVPKFVDYLFKMFIAVIEVLAQRMPELIMAGAKLLMAFVTGVLDALGELSGEDLQGLIVAISALIVVFTLITALGTVMAAAGVAILAMAGVLAILGGIAQIPGLMWLVNEGAKFMGAIGTAIGSFVGGLVGGFAGVASDALPRIGANLAEFMNAAKPFFDGVKGVDESASRGVAALAGAVLALTAANILEGLTSWFTGGTSLVEFGKELAEFSPYFKQYANSVAGIDGEVIQASANAALTLAEFASKLPNSGGIAGWFMGENSLSVFAQELVEFGPVLKQYADSVKGLDAGVVENSANAALALAEMANKLPNQGGVAGWFAGENSLSVFAEELAVFGPKLKTYADSVKGMDSDVVVNSANAAKALSELANNLPNQGGVVSWFTGDNNIGTFGENITTFGRYFKAYYDNVSGINITALNGVINGVWELVHIASGVKSVDMSGMANFGESLKTLGNMGINRFISAFDEAIQRFKDQGIKIATNVESGLKSNMSKFLQMGKDAAQGFINGINDKMSSATEAGRKLGEAALIAAQKALDSNSPSKEFIYLGQAIGEGLAIGIDNSIGDPVNATSNMIDQIISMSQKDIKEFEDWLNDRKYYNEISLSEELAAWEKVQARYLEGSEERKKADREVYRLQNELVKATYQYSIDWIEDRKYYNELSMEEELAAWERVQARYMEGSEERKKADREVYRLRNELGKESYDNSMDWIEEQKYYNKMSLADELAAYTRVQQRYAEGTEERKKMDREVYRVQQEINNAREKYYEDVARVQEERNNKRIQLEQEYADKTKQINEKLAQDIKQLDDAYASALDSRTKSLYNAYGLFDEVTKKKSVSGSTLMKNLQAQVDEFSDWRSQLNQLSAKGLNSALIDELEEMGPSAIAEIKALNSMSSSELAQYATLWATKHNQAKQQATSELEDLRIETQAQIADLRVQSAKELDDYRMMWNQQMSDLNKDTNEQLDKLKTDFNQKVGIMKTNTEEDFKQMTANVQEIMKQAGWNELGQQIVDGMTEGVQQKQSTFIDNLVGVVSEAVNAVKETLGIKSPSRVFANIGMYMDEGMVEGLERYRGRVADASKGVGQAGVDSMSRVINGIGKMLDNEMDVNPTIRPVFDLTDLRRGVDYIDGAFSAERSMHLGVNANTVNQNGNNSHLENLAKTLETANNTSNSKMISAIESMEAKLAGLVDKIGRLQVVMDTGTLVGAIGPEMDRELGGLATMKRRGVR